MRARAGSISPAPPMGSRQAAARVSSSKAERLSFDSVSSPAAARACADVAGSRIPPWYYRDGDVG
jgi:hypothetical protein